MSAKNHILDFPVSLVLGTRAEVVGQSTIFALLKEATSKPELLKAGVELRKANLESKKRYNDLKRNQPGFVTGQFSYRNAENCVKYIPVMGFDFDALGDKMASVIQKLKGWKFAALVFPSISGSGVRVFVETTATREQHKETYTALCEELAKVTGVRLRSKMMEGLRDAGMTPSESKQIVKDRPHLDDVTSDISRFWYYSGMSRSEVYVNQNREVYKFVAQKSNPSPVKVSRPSSDYDWSPTEAQKVEYCIDQLESRNIDITGGVKQWHKIGQVLFGEFGYMAESYFMRCCAMHPDFSEKECQKEFLRISQKHKAAGATIASFYQACKDNGVVLDFKELRRLHGPSKSVQLKTYSSPVSNDPEVIASINESERCVVATALMRSDYADDIFDAVPKFGSYCFSEPLHARIFKVIETLRLEGKQVNPASVITKSSYTENPITKEQITSLVSAPYYPTGVATNAILVFDAYRRVQLADLAEEARLRASAGEDVEDLLSDVESRLGAVSDTGDASTEIAMDALVGKVIDRMKAIEERRDRGGSQLTGVTTGNKGLDVAYDGRQSGHLYYKAARPAMGKTLAMLDEALAAANEGHPVGILSLEMPAVELANRMLANLSGLPLSKIARAQLGPDGYAQLVDAQNELSSLPIYIDDRGGPNSAYIKRMARKWKRKHGIKILFIDYLQLADLGKGNSSTNDKVGGLSKMLKQTAKNEEIAVVALSQLSRAVETRGGDKRPQLSDLRDSGNLEQDADGVEFPYRPEYYGIEEDEQGNSLKGILFHIIAKNRHGESKDVRSKVNLECQKIENLDESDFNLLPSAVDRYEAKKSSQKKQPLKIIPENELPDPNGKSQPYGCPKAMAEARANMTPEDELPF